MNDSRKTGCSRSMNNRLLNRDIIKYVAMVAMLLNHIAYIFFSEGTIAYEILTDIGYFTAITMCYFLVEGYEYTRSKKNYALRLLIFAIVSQIPFSLAFTKDGILDFAAANMLFTLLACFGIIHVMKTMPERRERNWLISGLVLVTSVGDWGIIAPVFTIFFVNAGKDREKQKSAWIISVLLFGVISYVEAMERLPVVQNLFHSLGCIAGAALAGLCIHYLYNGKQMEKGKTFSKWFFYLFYPLHLLVLGILRVM